jgi:hypothetical protein
MKIADCYFNTKANQVILSGEYEGGIWHIEVETENGIDCKWILNKEPRHCRGFLHVAEDSNLLKILSIVENLK